MEFYNTKFDENGHREYLDATPNYTGILINKTAHEIMWQHGSTTDSFGDECYEPEEVVKIAEMYAAQYSRILSVYQDSIKRLQKEVDDLKKYNMQVSREGKI